MPATQSLSEAAEAKLTDAINDAVDDAPTILWWDEGGYLENIVKTAADSLGCEFHVATDTPLELRATAPRDQTVWYAPNPKDEYTDWFEDIETTGNVISADIGALAVACFENDQVQAWSLQSAYEDASDTRRVAELLYESLETSSGLPGLETLQTQIVLDGDENPIKYVLERSADRLPTDETLDDIQELLLSHGVDAVEGVTDPEQLVFETHKWAVAEWLIDAGVDTTAFPPAYRSTDNDSIGINRPELKSLLAQPATPTGMIAERFLDPETDYWSDVIADLDDPLAYCDCVVGGALEARLWELWEAAYEDGDYERAATFAEQRHKALAELYDENPWLNSWAQAGDVTTLARELTAWESTDETDDVVALYGDLEDGSWQIDLAVYELIVSGSPEDALPSAHPAVQSLGSYRETLLEDEYITYLEDLGELVEAAFEDGAVFTNQDHSHQFFSVEREQLQSGQEVVIFVIDGLRFDLAHLLAEELRSNTETSTVVTEQPWVGTLPSETAFGKAALTPGNKFNFGIRLTDDEELIPIRNGQEISNYWRQNILENDGWTYITKSKGQSGWGDSRVIYYYDDIDELGHKNLDDFEALFADRITSIATEIEDKLTQGEWDTAYVVTDHGFVSLPIGTKLRSEPEPSGANTVSRRFAAGQELGDHNAGIRLDSDSPVRYIQDKTTIDVLTDPKTQFQNQGHGDVRYLHGGALPQEFVLNFLRIEQE